jgi:phosphoribosylamine--glycine ligase
MKVLIIGSGGREHAIAWKVQQSAEVSKIYCAPGNGGITQIADCIDIGVMEFEKLIIFAKKEKIDLVIIGPDAPLVEGIVDEFEKSGIMVFGPNKAAAILEGSKVFSKELMKKYKIPTADYRVFDKALEALVYLETSDYPVVLKADGLALGKGVLICETKEAAVAGVQTIMKEKQFGDAGNLLVVESFMTGPEVSVLAFVDGKTIKTMTSAQDHKRALDNDKGLNTGGMGAFSPSPFYTKEIEEFCNAYIFKPTVDAMNQEGRPFKGIIFFGLMLTPNGPKVLEYNARFGDPETQVVLPRLKNDLIEVIISCIEGTLDNIELEFEEEAAVCVVLASEGYPSSYEKGAVITKLESLSAETDCMAFHAGTILKEGNLVTNGGRVLAITAKAKTSVQAREKAYIGAKYVEFSTKYYRTDIGKAITN